MEHHTTQLIALFGQRLARLKDLACEIEAGQHACIALDLETLRAHDDRKGHLCREIHRLDLEIRGLMCGVDPAGSLPAGTEVTGKLNALKEGSEAARLEVARRNGVYALFLARSRATLQVMANVVSHCQGVYPKLQQTASTAAPFERSA